MHGIHMVLLVQGVFFEGLQGIEPQGFFALARTGQQDDRARQALRPHQGLGELRPIRLGIELQIAQHALHRRTQGAQALCIGRGLGPYRRQAGISRA